MKYIITKPEDTESWPGWEPEMDKYAGIPVTIDHYHRNETSVSIKEDRQSWSWHKDWLKPIGERCCTL